MNPSSTIILTTVGNIDADKTSAVYIALESYLMFDRDSSISEQRAEVIYLKHASLLQKLKRAVLASSSVLIKKDKDFYLVQVTDKAKEEIKKDIKVAKEESQMSVRMFSLHTDVAAQQSRVRTCIRTIYKEMGDDKTVLFELRLLINVKASIWFIKMWKEPVGTTEGLADLVFGYYASRNEVSPIMLLHRDDKYTGNGYEVGLTEDQWLFFNKLSDNYTQETIYEQMPLDVCMMAHSFFVTEPAGVVTEEVYLEATKQGGE